MIKQFIPEGFCLECLGCCRFREANSVWLPCLLDEEAQMLLDKKIPPVSITGKRRIHPLPAPNQDGFICPFLNLQDNKCGIYDFRPFECQLYPFLIKLSNKKIILTVDLNCPYVKENLKSERFKEYAEYLAAFLNSKEQKRLLKDNPQILQAYEEVLDVVELEDVDEAK